MNNTLAVWWASARPKTLGAAAAPVLMGTAVAHFHQGAHLPAALAALVCALLIQVGTNLANDYFDARRGADTVERLGPRRGLQHGTLSAEQVRRGFILCFVLAVLLGAYLLARGGWPILLIGLSSVALGVLYTGGPAPLAYTGLGDLAAFLWFGPVAVVGTTYVQSFQWPPAAWLGGVGAGCFSLALLSVNNFRDLEQDRAAGKRTLAVRFGEGVARWEFRVALLAALLAPLLLLTFPGDARPPAAGLLATSAFLLAWLPGLWRAVRPPAARDPEFGGRMNRLLGQVGRLEVGYAVLFSLAHLLGSGR